MRKKVFQNIYIDYKIKLFSLNLKSYKFAPGNHKIIETTSNTLNHILGLIYELNLIRNIQNTKTCPIYNYNIMAI